MASKERLCQSCGTMVMLWVSVVERVSWKARSTVEHIYVGTHSMHCKLLSSDAEA